MTPAAPEPPTLAPADLCRWRPRELLRPALAFAFLVAALAVVYFSPLQGYLHEVRHIRTDLQQTGHWEPIIYMLAVFLLTSIGVPRLLFCVLGGILFGFKMGLLWTQLPTLAGYYATFCFLRWGGRNFVSRRWPRLTNTPFVFGKHAAFKLILLRQVPITGIIINSFLAVSPMRHRDFLLGTALGLLPQAIPVTLIGSSAVKTERSDQMLFLGVAFLVFLGYLAFRQFARRSATELPDLTDPSPGPPPA